MHTSSDVGEWQSCGKNIHRMSKNVKTMIRYPNNYV